MSWKAWGREGVPRGMGRTCENNNNNNNEREKTSVG